MSASRPPEHCTKRSRMWRSFSLFSAPPIGMIQPRVWPSGTMLGMACRLGVGRSVFERSVPQDLSCAHVQLAADDHGVRTALRVERHEIRVCAGHDLAL